MNAYPLNGPVFGLLASSLPCVVLGLLLLLTEKRFSCGSKGSATRWLFHVLLFSSACGTALLGQHSLLWVSLGALACFWPMGLLLKAAGRTRIARGLGQLLCQHHLLALALIALGVGNLLAWSDSQEKKLPKLDGSQEVWAWTGTVRCKKAPFQFLTDQGRPVGTFMPGDPEELPLSVESEDRYLHHANLADRVTRTASADHACNCHGWVFTSGRFWISGDDIDAILHDNGYIEVSAPEVNDLAISRGEGNTALHTAIVRTVNADGSTVVESKWGMKGTFLHAPKDQLYGQEIHYYRTERGSHQLRSPDNKLDYSGESRIIRARGSSVQ